MTVNKNDRKRVRLQPVESSSHCRLYKTNSSVKQEWSQGPHEKTVSMFKYWDESFMYGIKDEWEKEGSDMFKPDTPVIIDDVFIYSNQSTLKSRSSRNPMAHWVRIISCDRERFIEDLEGVI